MMIQQHATRWTLQPVTPSLTEKDQNGSVRAGHTSVNPPVELHDRLTLWGLTPRELHDAYWIARGVQCIRQGEEVRIDRTADLYLLLRQRQFVLFDLRQFIERLVWRGSYVTRLRVMVDAGDDSSYRERIRIDELNLVKCIERQYSSDAAASHRVLLVQRPKLAEYWMNSADACEAGKMIRRSVPQSRVDRFGHPGQCFLAGDKKSERTMLNELVGQWRTPQCSIEGIEEAKSGIWIPKGQSLPKHVTLVAPLWLGWGQIPAEEQCIIGPAWRADDPAEAQQVTQAVRLLDCFDVEVPDETSRLPSNPRPMVYPCVKRVFDIVVSVTVLIGAAPLILLIALAIVAETGFPVLFGHKRQSRGGKPFFCLKFRTMHQNAEKMVEQLRERNQCDGPQVNIKDDPRITRMGRVLRRFCLDELPQFWNVLVGEMSIVGPRPSPDSENQYCPAWRELRLSVRPGITGLWQLRRTRLPGRDFHEWIRYDIEYVRQASFWFDLKICLQTARIIFFGRNLNE